MNVDLKGFDEKVATFIADDTVKAGSLVKFTDNFTVSACEQGNEFMGVCVNVGDGYAAVQIAGYVEIPTNQMFGCGYYELCATNSNSAGRGSSSVPFLVLYCDGEKLGIIL